MLKGYVLINLQSYVAVKWAADRPNKEGVASTDIFKPLSNKALLSKSLKNIHTSQALNLYFSLSVLCMNFEEIHILTIKGTC